MKKLAVSAYVLLVLCGPALADAPRADSFKVKLALREGAALRAFEVSVVSDAPCATVHDRTTDREIDIEACGSRAGQLDVDWFTRSPRGELRSTSSLALAHGATAELGPAEGPRFTVTV
jgi:hypothetical protein